MLRFVRDARRTAVCANEQQRDVKNMRERRQWADGITEARILHHRHRESTADARPGSRGNCVPLVGSRDILQRGVVNDMVDKRGEERTGYAGVPSKPCTARRFDKFNCFNHVARQALSGRWLRDACPTPAVRFSLRHCAIWGDTSRAAVGVDRPLRG